MSLTKRLGKIPLIRKIYFFVLVRKTRIKLGLMRFIYGNYIDTLNVEFSSYCNLKCKWCILNKKGVFMDIELFKKLLKEITSNPNLKIGNLALWNAGETLMHPEFVEFMNLLSEAKKRTKRFPHVSLLTNATLLNEKNSRAILNSNAIDSILFSVDGRNEEEFEKFRVGAKWDAVKRNILQFLSLNKSLGKNIHTGIISIQPEKGEMSKEFVEFYSSVDDYRPRQVHDFDGSTYLGIAKQPVLKGLCHYIQRSLVINSDGKVTVCCVDLNERGIIGDYKNQNLLEIWNGRTRKKWVKLMKENKRQDIELCKNCSMINQ